MKNSIFSFLLILPWISHAQSIVTLRGKVVELKENKPVGVPGVVVSVSGESYDITAPDGSFKLTAPKGLDYVTITIKGSSSTMISPYEGKVNIPPQYEPIEITLCQENNQKLLQKVADLNSKVKALQKTNKLTSQQAERLQRTMLDTILHYQTLVNSLESNLSNVASENTNLKNQLKEMIAKNEMLEQKLFAALADRFKNQQTAFETISTGINNYVSRLKDIQWILPTDAMACVTNAAGACNQFYSTIEKYNTARNYINDHKDEHVQASVLYWDNAMLTDELKSTYDYILTTIHEPLLFNKMNQEIINPLKQRSTGKTSLKTAKREIQVASKAISEELVPLIKTLESQKDKLYFDFKNSIQ